MAEHEPELAKDSEPRLVREVELPRPKSSAAATALVCTMAMFTAVGASAFVVRGRAAVDGRCPAGLPPPRPASYGPGTTGLTPPSSMPGSLQDDRLVDQFWDARNKGDVETALDLYLHVSGPRRRELASARDEMARAYYTDQLRLVTEAAEDLQCEVASDRLARLQRLVPDAKVPLALDACLLEQR